MAKVSTLIRKGYLLAGVIMAANMLVVNEIKAMKEDDNINNITEDNKNTEKIDIKSFFYIGPCKYIGFLLQWENTINLVGGALFTFANGLYNFYENKPSFYFDWLFAGWNSNPFANGYLQFCPNINLGRGIFWLVMHYTQTILIRPYFENIIKDLTVIRGMEKISAGKFANLYCLYFFCEYTPLLIGNIVVENMKSDNKKKDKIYNFILFLLRLLQNFVSVPLRIHLPSRFSISIAFDAIMWMVVTHFVVGKTYDAEVEGMKDTLTNLFFPKKTNSIEN